MRHPAAYILPIGLKHPPAGESIWKQARASWLSVMSMDRHLENCFVQKDVSKLGSGKINDKYIFLVNLPKP